MESKEHFKNEISNFKTEKKSNIKNYENTEFEDNNIDYYNENKIVNTNQNQELFCLSENKFYKPSNNSKNLAFTNVTNSSNSKEKKLKNKTDSYFYSAKNYETEEVQIVKEKSNNDKLKISKSNHPKNKKIINMNSNLIKSRLLEVSTSKEMRKNSLNNKRGIMKVANDDINLNNQEDSNILFKKIMDLLENSKFTCSKHLEMDIKYYNQEMNMFICEKCDYKRDKTLYEILNSLKIKEFENEISSNMKNIAITANNLSSKKNYINSYFLDQLNTLSTSFEILIKQLKDKKEKLKKVLTLSYHDHLEQLEKLNTFNNKNEIFSLSIKNKFEYLHNLLEERQIDEFYKLYSEINNDLFHFNQCNSNETPNVLNSTYPKFYMNTDCNEIGKLKYFFSFEELKKHIDCNDFSNQQSINNKNSIFKKRSKSEKKSIFDFNFIKRSQTPLNNRINSFAENENFDLKLVKKESSSTNFNKDLKSKYMIKNNSINTIDEVSIAEDIDRSFSAYPNILKESKHHGHHDVRNVSYNKVDNKKINNSNNKESSNNLTNITNITNTTNIFNISTNSVKDRDISKLSLNIFKENLLSDNLKRIDNKNDSNSSSNKIENNNGKKNQKNNNLNKTKIPPTKKIDLSCEVNQNLNLTNISYNSNKKKELKDNIDKNKNAKMHYEKKDNKNVHKTINENNNGKEKKIRFENNISARNHQNIFLYDNYLTQQNSKRMKSPNTRNPKTAKLVNLSSVISHGKKTNDKDYSSEMFSSIKDKNRSSLLTISNITNKNNGNENKKEFKDLLSSQASYKSDNLQLNKHSSGKIENNKYSDNLMNKYEGKITKIDLKDLDTFNYNQHYTKQLSQLSQISKNSNFNFGNESCLNNNFYNNEQGNTMLSSIELESESKNIVDESNNMLNNPKKTDFKNENKFIFKCSDDIENSLPKQKLNPNVKNKSKDKLINEKSFKITDEDIYRAKTENSHSIKDTDEYRQEKNREILKTYKMSFEGELKDILDIKESVNKMTKGNVNNFYKNLVYKNNDTLSRKKMNELKQNDNIVVKSNNNYNNLQVSNNNINSQINVLNTPSYILGSPILSNNIPNTQNNKSISATVSKEKRKNKELEELKKEFNYYNGIENFITQNNSPTNENKTKNYLKSNNDEKIKSTRVANVNNINNEKLNIKVLVKNNTSNHILTNIAKGSLINDKSKQINNADKIQSDLGHFNNINKSTKSINEFNESSKSNSNIINISKKDENSLTENNSDISNSFKNNFGISSKNSITNLLSNEAIDKKINNSTGLKDINFNKNKTNFQVNKFSNNNLNLKLNQNNKIGLNLLNVNVNSNSNLNYNQSKNVKVKESSSDYITEISNNSKGISNNNIISSNINANSSSNQMIKKKGNSKLSENNKSLNNI